MKILTLSLTLFISLFAQFSAFGAGDLDSESPYGLSESEKHILKNRKSIENLERDLKGLNLKFTNLQNSIDGLKSIIEGRNLTIKDIKSDISSVKESLTKNEVVDELKEEVFKLQERSNSIVESTKSNFESQYRDFNSSFQTLRESMLEFGKNLKVVSENYIPKDDLNAHLKSEFERFKIELLKEVEKYINQNSKPKESSKVNFDKVDSLTLYREAKSLYSKKKYDKAVDRFKILIKRHYKPATSNYYLGEIAYYSKNYEDALFHYKKSVELYDKSSFMPTLLLHSGVASEKLNDIESAKLFYQSIIDNYSEKKVLEIAKEKLANLK